MNAADLARQLRAEAERAMKTLQFIADEIEAMDAGAATKTPYRSQWDADGMQFRRDCGPACVAMLAEARGIRVTIDEIARAAGLGPGHAYTTAADLIHAAATKGLALRAVAGWTAADFAPHLPAIVLVHYGSIPDRLDQKYTGGHWMVLLAVDDEAVTVHDPDWWPPRRAEGERRRIAREVFERALVDCGLDKNPVGYGIVAE